jgi:hypothetical protein
MRPDSTAPRERRRAPVRRVVAAVSVVVVLGALSGCSLFGHNNTSTVVPVLKAVPGDCVVAPTAITTEIKDLKVVPCTEPHQQEVYALAPYPVTAGSASSAPYPGEAALKAFADGACLDAFAGYVGSDYRDSSLYFTYLLPSARGWQAGEDRDVTCFITTTGAMRTSSVKGSDL